MAKMELEVGPSPTGVMLAIKSVEGRMHQVMAIDGVDVQVQTANNMAFQAERAVAAGGSSPLVSISALRSCAGAEGHASHEFSGLGHFRLFLPADGTAAAPGLY